MARTYLPVLLLIAFAAFNAAAIIVLSTLLVRRRPTPEKLAPYESGIPVIGLSRQRFSVKFYMVAMLFIVFDIETVFMIPWGVYYRELSCSGPLLATGVCPTGQMSFFGLGEMIVFMLILLVGYVYVWKKGALQWD
jgi:NADH-quinone oxidoreductase subunit A